MGNLVFPDTPIDRVSMEAMDASELHALVELFQERRMRAHSIYERAMQAKQDIKDAKDAEQLEKRLLQMQKLFVTVDNGLDKLRKYSAEVQVLRLAMEL